MTRQTALTNSLVGSPARGTISRLCALTLAAILITGGAIAGFGQTEPAPIPPAKPAAKPGLPTPTSDAAGKIMGKYDVHSTLELGGNIVSQEGSAAMWATMVNQTSGMRVVGQSLFMHTKDPSKTPFFDTLSTASFGYGGEPVDGSYLKFSKGKWYDFDGSFRRNRSYFDYNSFVNSFLTNATAAAPVLVPEPSTLHIYNTVRHDTNAVVTLLPVARISFRVGYNHGTTEGPTYSTAHVGGDVQLYQWFRNGLDTYTAGADAKLAKRTTLSYDQFFAFYRGDTSNELAPTPFALRDGTPTSLGVNVLTGPTQTCGAGAARTQHVINGIANPFCNQTVTETMSAPTRTSFPTEQLRFSSHYWDKVAMNGRVAYNSGVSNINSFNQTFVGLARAGITCPNGIACLQRQEVETGAGTNGQFAHNKRINVNADWGMEAELNKYLSVTDTFNYWDFRIPSVSDYSRTFLTGPTATTSALTPLTSGTLTTTIVPTLFTQTLAQKNTGNIVIAIVNAAPGVKLSGGWRFNDRQITFAGDPTMNWHQNGAVAGLVVQPSRVFRLNLNYEGMNSSSADSTTTPSNTYTREAPNSIQHIRFRTMYTPKHWVNLAVTYNSYSAKNDDPLIEHKEHNRDFSFAAQFNPIETLSLDLNYAHDSVFSQTDLCYAFTATANAPLPAGAGSPNTATCQYNTTTTPLYLGYGAYDVPTNFYIAALTYAPSKYFKFNGGVRITGSGGQAMLLNPYNAPGAISSNVVSPYSDMQINIAPQWSWHGNWVHHGYSEDGGPGGSIPAAGGVIPSRNFHGDVVTLSVKYAF